MATDSFYPLLAQAGFTILGFWLAVVQLRGADLVRTRRRRRLAHSASVQLALPAVMGLLALADPASRTLWRVAFVAAAAVGIGTLLALREPGAPALAVAAQGGAMALYAAVALVALVPADRLPARPLAIEGVLLSTLVFLGLNVAFGLLFTPDDGPPPARG